MTVTVNYEGKEYKLVDEAEVQCDGRYMAFAVEVGNGEENEVCIYWDTTDEWKEALQDENLEVLENESEACDWENPVAVQGVYF